MSPFSTKIFHKIAKEISRSLLGNFKSVKYYYESVERALKLISGTLSVSARVHEIKELEEAGFERWSLVLRRGNIEKWIGIDYFSKGLRSLFSLVIPRSLLLMASERGLIPLIFLDEPEASLDTYILSNMPYLLGDLADLGVVLISTHREHLISALEDLMSRGSYRTSKLYEFLWNENLDNIIKEALYSEETGRFDIKRAEELLPE